jgi:hypothetical protein
MQALATALLAVMGKNLLNESFYCWQLTSAPAGLARLTPPHKTCPAYNPTTLPTTVYQHECEGIVHDVSQMEEDPHEALL